MDDALGVHRQYSAKISIMLQRLRQIIEQKKGQRDKVNSLLLFCRKEIAALKKELIYSEQAQTIIQKVAQETQKQLEWHISEIVTLALASTFDTPYTFKAEFVMKRGKTECNLFFERDGHQVNPVLEAGGGAVDVAAFALRVAMWSLSKSKWRNTLIFDEPFKNINDKTRKTQESVAKTVRELSKKLNLQFIIITMLPEFEDIADRIFEFNLVKGKTKIEAKHNEET